MTTLYTLDDKTIEQLEDKSNNNIYKRVRKYINLGKVLRYKRLSSEHNPIGYANRVIKINGVKILDA